MRVCPVSSSRSGPGPSKVLLVLGLVLGMTAVLSTLAVGAFLWSGLSGSLPSDAELRKRFQDHRAEFDSLATMALADTLLVGAGAWPLTSVFIRGTGAYNRRLTDEEVVSTGRSAYRRLLARAGVPAISRSRKGDAVTFVVQTSQRQRKGICYSKDPPPYSQVASLDRVADYGYVVLAPRWYLFVELRD